MKRPEGFEWDDLKATANLEKHGVRFDYASRVFLDPLYWLGEVSRAGEGEIRWKAVGRIDGRTYTVIHTWRGETVRLISARPANPPERRNYDRQFHS